MAPGSDPRPADSDAEARPAWKPSSAFTPAGRSTLDGGILPLRAAALDSSRASVDEGAEFAER